MFSTFPKVRKKPTRISVLTSTAMWLGENVGHVNISQATYSLLKDDSEFAFESRGKIEAKGKGEIEMYIVSLKTEKE